MKLFIYLSALAIVFLFFTLPLTSEKTEERPENIFGFTMNDIDGNPVHLEKYKGKVILLVNVASKCGLTPQYKGLQNLYSDYKQRNFVILGFPANNFLRQEPGSDKEIKSFCSLNFGVEFPMFSKISVKGKKQHPLYKFLTSKLTNPEFPGKIRWNFEKFIFDKNGKLAGRFHPKIKPQDQRITSLIEKLISEEK